MAMMAREVGIPSRVAVGFLPGERVEDNTWEVSIRDMHAWPELYFAGYGWVRFEPTPASVTGTAPSWTVPQAEAPNDDESPPSDAAVVRASAAVRGADRPRPPPGPPTPGPDGLGLAADPDRCAASGCSCC